MPRNGSGTYSLVAGNPVVTGTTISSTWANNTFSDLATAMTASVAKDGQTPITANFNWGGFNITNLGTVSGTTLTASGTITGANYVGSGTGGRFTADLSNTTHINRFSFQTSTTNGNTILGVIPNGTGTTGQFNAYNSSNPDTSAALQLSCGPSAAVIRSQAIGAGTPLPLEIYASSTLAATMAITGAWTFATGVTFSAAVTLGSAAVATSPAATDNDTSVATTAYVKDQLSTDVAAFNYQRSTNQTSGTTILFATAVFTEYPSAGANYNTGTGTFTAPANGIYAFDAQATVQNNTGAAQAFVLNLIGNATTFSTDIDVVQAANAGAARVSGIMALSAGQTVIVNTSSPGLSGSFIVTGGYFSGRLVSLT